MAIFVPGQENTTDNLNWFLRVQNLPFNAYEVGFQIVEKNTGNDNLIFPDSGYEDVTDAPGRFEDGGYYAYDSASGSGWAPSASIQTGEYCARWRWKDSENAPYQTGSESFSIVAQSTESCDYVTTAYVRQVTGISDSVSDDEILRQIKIAQENVERQTRTWFCSKRLTYVFDGRNTSKALHLAAPIQSVVSLSWINDDGTETIVDPSKYSVRNYEQGKAGYVRMKRGVFEYGVERYKIVGDFGYAQVPEAIKEVVARLVYERVSNPVNPDNDSGNLPSVFGGLLQSEKTDRHSVAYFSRVSSNVSTFGTGAIQGLTSDPWIWSVLLYYRRTAKIATSSKNTTMIQGAG